MSACSIGTDMGCDLEPGLWLIGIPASSDTQSVGAQETYPIACKKIPYRRVAMRRSCVLDLSGRAWLLSDPESQILSAAFLSHD
jgi:hypothetical protein